MSMKRVGKVIGSMLGVALAVTGCKVDSVAPEESVTSVPAAARVDAPAIPVAAKSGIRMAPAPQGANAVIEGHAPGLEMLGIQLFARDSGESRYEWRVEDGQVSGAIVLPRDAAADYSIQAFDEEGRLTHESQGTMPALAQLDKPVRIPLQPAKDSEGTHDGIVLTVSRERLVLSSEPSPEDPREMVVRASLFDASGERLEFDPRDLAWHMADDRYIELRPHFDPFDVKVVVKKEFEKLELCPLKPLAVACLPNGLCKPLRVCDDPWKQISAGNEHTCALTRSGAAFCWGINTQGQLGTKTLGSCMPTGAQPREYHSRPQRVECPADSPCRFTQISAGETLTAALDVNGDVWWWGRGSPDHHRVNAVLAGASQTFSQVTAGFGHACALSQNRSEVWCWGTNAHGEAGALRTLREVSGDAPARVLVPLKFRKVVAGGEHTCAIGSTGVDVVCWGRDDENQSSGPNSTQAPASGSGPFWFQHFGGLVSILDVAVSANSTCVKLPYTVQCWGANFWLNAGLLGSPDRLAVGFGHLCALNGLQASCMGTNNWGELGIGSRLLQTAPVPVKAPPPEYVDIDTGTTHTCGITPSGEAFCWGNNTSGQVGDGTANYGPTAPVQVAAH